VLYVDNDVVNELAMLQKAAAIMPVISEPLKELVGQGSNNGAVRGTHTA